MELYLWTADLSDSTNNIIKEYSKRYSNRFKEVNGFLPLWIKKIELAKIAIYLAEKGLVPSFAKEEFDSILEMKVHNNYSKLKFDFLRLSNIVQHRNKRNKDFVCETLLGVFLRIQEKHYCITTFDVDVCNGKPSNIEVYKIQSCCNY